MATKDLPDAGLAERDADGSAGAGHAIVRCLPGKGAGGFSMTGPDEPPILLNGQVQEEPVRLQNGDTVVLVNPAVAGKIVVGPLRNLGPNGYQAAHIATEPPGAMPSGAPEDWYFTRRPIYEIRRIAPSGR